MGRVRVTEYGYLYFDFFCKGIRCKEYTKLKNNRENRKKMQEVLEKMEAEITLGAFDYEKYFPNGSRVGVFGGPARPTNKKSFEEFAREWFSQNEIEWKTSTARSFKSILEATLIPYFGKKVVNEITKADVKLFRVNLKKRSGKRGEALSNKSINNICVVLRLILNEAAELYGTPSTFEKIKPLKVAQPDIHPFTLEEVEIFLKGVRKDFRNYYLTRFFTGMRTGEVDGLKWKYVDFVNGKIMVRETLAGGKFATPKNQTSVRDIDMLPPVREALLRQKKKTYKISEFVFCNAEGEHLDYNNVTKRIWYPTLKRLGIIPRIPYQTRHTAATLMLASGENPEWIAKQLGHANTDMLFKRYSKFIPNLTRKDGSAFIKMLKDKGAKIC